MPWKPEYAERRRKKYQSDAAERERRKSQGRSPEKNREYMREYYIANPEKFSCTEERKQRHNASRRKRYAEDPEYAERCKESARSRSSAARRDSRLKATYGISQADFERMLEDQGYACAICATKHEDKRGKVLHVDHCHATGRVRQLLCTACNTALGKMRDDTDRLRSAIAYLERHKV